MMRRAAGPQAVVHRTITIRPLDLDHTSGCVTMEVGHLPVSKSMEDKMKNKEISAELQLISNHLAEARNRLDELYQVLFLDRDDLELDEYIKDVCFAVEDAEGAVDQIIDEGVDSLVKVRA